METVIQVNVCPIGETTRQVTVTSGTTVEECLRIADVSHNGRAIRIGDKEATLGTPVVVDGAKILLANKNKAG